MNAYIIEEIKRALISRGTLITVIISIVVFFVGMLELIGWALNGNASLLYVFLSGYNSGTANFLVLIFPLIACLPFSASYVSDSKSGLNKYIFFRMSKSKYMAIKLLLNGLVGGFVLFIGPFVGFIFLLIIKIFTGIPLIKEQMETVEFFQSIGVNSPTIMVIIILFTLFFCGFILATLALGVSTIIRNVYLTVLFPFVLYIVSATVLNKIHPFINVQGLYDVNFFGMSFTQKLIYGVIILGLGTTLFFVGGLKVEQKNI